MPAPRARPWKSISEKHAARCVCVWMCGFKEYHQTLSRGETLTLTALIRELDAGDASPQIRAGARGDLVAFRVAALPSSLVQRFAIGCSLVVV